MAFLAGFTISLGYLLNTVLVFACIRGIFSGVKGL